jgi:hypothetical protein
LFCNIRDNAILMKTIVNLFAVLKNQSIFNSTVYFDWKNDLMGLKTLKTCPVVSSMFPLRVCGMVTFLQMHFIFSWNVSNDRLFSQGVKIWTVYFRSYWSYKNAFIWTKYVIMSSKLCNNRSNEPLFTFTISRLSFFLPLRYSLTFTISRMSTSDTSYHIQCLFNGITIFHNNKQYICFWLPWNMKFIKC